jgi:mono/diheme cytochrome c family protein
MRLAVVAMLAAVPALAAAESERDAALNRTFLLHCAGCHHADGHGLPSHGIPDLAGTGPLAGDPDGRRYLIQVPGVAQSRLDDETVAEMLTWILRRFAASPTADLQPFTAAEVEKWRGQTMHDPVGRRAAIAARLPASGPATPAQPY